MGFKFQVYEVPALLTALKRSLETFTQPAQWQDAMRRAMAMDFILGQDRGGLRGYLPPSKRLWAGRAEDLGHVPRDVLAHVVEIANSPVDVGERWDSILGVINTNLGCRQSVLFFQEHARSMLVKSNAWPKDPASAPALAVELGVERVGEIARRREPQFLNVTLPSSD
ncbi:hypothetical protein DFAR_940009 [Desulfarculales bacterium]